MKQKLLIIAILALIAIVAYQKYSQYQIKNTVEFKSDIQLQSIQKSWKEYIDDKFKISFRYPESLKIETINYDQGTSMIIYLDKNELFIPATNNHGRIGAINIQIAPIGPNDTYYDSSSYLSLTSTKIGVDQVESKISEEITDEYDTRTGMKNIHYLSNTIIQNGYVYTISLHESNPTFQSTKILYDQIISTLKFTD